MYYTITPTSRTKMMTERSSMHEKQRQLHDAADEEARRWWSEREASAEKNISLSLHKRMEAQRAQIHAFKLEQSKWEHELQLRISKYAHDRKLLSEQNIELQEALVAMEDKYAKLQQERDLQTAHIVELEGQLNQTQANDQQLRELRAENQRLTERVVHLESMRSADVANALKQQENVYNQWMDALQAKLVEAQRERMRLRDECTMTDRIKRRLRDDSITQAGDVGSFVSVGYIDQDQSAEQTAERAAARIAELDKALKYKEQAIVSLKAMLERHESISDEKINLLQAKYDQVKAINVALQRRLLHALVEEEASQHGQPKRIAIGGL